MAEEIRILGLLIKDRIKEAGRTQQVLTKHAYLIRSRLGFHEVTSDVCSRVGVVILQLTGETTACDRLEAELSEIGGLELQKMTFRI